MSGKAYYFKHPKENTEHQFGSRPVAVREAAKLGLPASAVQERARKTTGTVTEVVRPGNPDSTAEIQE